MTNAVTRGGGERNRTPAVIAHRGAGPHGPERENTLPAIEAARRLGADGVEIDVRRARGGEPVVLHDPWLPCGDLVCETSPQELPSDVPSLAEALAVSHGLFVNLEVKNWPAEPDFDPEETLARRTAALLTGAAERLSLCGAVLSSFSPASVAASAGVVETALLAEVGDVGDLLATARRTGARGLHPVDRLATPELIAAAHAAGLAVRVWTVDEPSRLFALSRLRVEAVITNEVAAARRAIGLASSRVRREQSEP